MGTCEPELLRAAWPPRGALAALDAGYPQGTLRSKDGAHLLPSSEQPLTNWLAERKSSLRKLTGCNCVCMALVCLPSRVPLFHNPTDCSPPRSSVHGTLQARTLEWVAMPSSRGLPDPGTEPTSPALGGRCVTAEPPGRPRNKISFACALRV